MADPEEVERVKGLLQDLNAYSEERPENLERLLQELEATLDDFRRLLDFAPKNDASRKAVQSGTIQVDDAEYRINEDFQQAVLKVADAVNVDEIYAAKLYLNAQDDAMRTRRDPFLGAIYRYHQHRQYLLMCLRVILRESLNDEGSMEEDNRRVNMETALLVIFDTQGHPTKNASKFTKKCIGSMRNIEKRLQGLGDQVQKISVVGAADAPHILDAIEIQRTSLSREHEQLGAIVCYLFKGGYGAPEDFRALLDSMKNIDRFDRILIQYMPALIAATNRFGSPETGNLQDARSLHRKITGAPDTEPWHLQGLHAAASILWLSEYSGWYNEDGGSVALDGVNLEEESQIRSSLFTRALADGALEFILAICYNVMSLDWHDPSRRELVTLLLADGNGLTLDGPPPLDMTDLLKEHFEAFVESCIANMPDAVRRLKTEEDSLRLGLLETRESIQLGTLQSSREAPLHLECFLVIIAFAYEGRPAAAEEFWNDPEGNLFGFLHWASKRQTVPRVSAFCEMLCAVSQGEECAKSAHRFLLEEGQMPAQKLKRSASMSWAQMFAELQLYAARVGERSSTPTQSATPIKRTDPSQMSEPESPLMLACYLRLISHMSRESAAARDWLLNHPSFDVRHTLLVLNCATIPAHLRASIFGTLEALMTDRSLEFGENMWLRLDSAFTGGILPPSQKPANVTNASVWSERLMFDSISNSFEESNSFVSLLESIISPPRNAPPLRDWLPFPESLGSSYRMPGIEPYVDFVMGRILAKKLPELLDSCQILMLRWKCLCFISTCLSTFNENLVVMANQSPEYSIDQSMKASSLKAYISLHPFSRVMEWLFNEDVAKVIFASSHQDIDQDQSEDSLQVLSVWKSVEVINLVLELQATYLDMIRPLIKKQLSGRRKPVANSSVASFEDFVVNHPRIIADLSRYLATENQNLILASLALLRKLSSSRKLNRSPNSLGRSFGPSRVIEMLESEEEPDIMARVIVENLQLDNREIEVGPGAPAYLIKLSVFGFLNSCLTAIPDYPNIAHLFLGFGHTGNTLTIIPEGTFSAETSLFHSILGLLRVYPFGLENSFLSWMLLIKEEAMRVLRNLWSSSLTSPIAVPELRRFFFLSSQFVAQPLVRLTSVWDGLTISSEDFLTNESSNALTRFLQYRALLYAYVVTELRFVFQEGSASVQAQIISTLMGSSVTPDGEVISHANIFDLFDFADLDLFQETGKPPQAFLRAIDLESCVVDDTPDLGRIYDVVNLEELIELKRTELINLRHLQPSSPEEHQFTAEADELRAFCWSANQVHKIRSARLEALRNWVEVVMVVVELCQMDRRSKVTLILQALQVLLPRLEKTTYDHVTEATEMARLMATLVRHLDTNNESEDPGRAGDVINDRLFQTFRVCINGIPGPQTPAALRDLFYTICSQYLARLADSVDNNPNLCQQSMQVVKAAGERFVDVICDDSLAGQEDSKMSSLLLLSLLVGLSRQTDSTFMVDSFVRLNYLGLILDSIKNISFELQKTDPKDVSPLLSHYNAEFLLLLQVAQTRVGAMHVLNVGLFNAIRKSQLFAADPDIGIDIDSPETLRQYYELLSSVIRIITSTILSRGPRNQQSFEYARIFLAENRQSIVGVFKRYAGIGGVTSRATRNDLGELVKSYVALITLAGYVEHEEEAGRQQVRKGFT